MKLVNGHGKIENGKYIANEADKAESITFMNEMDKRVKDILKKKFGRFIQGKEYRPGYSDQLQQASSYLWTPVINLDTSNFRCSRSAFVHVETGNNANGYNQNEAKRFFVISFELNGSMRYKYQKRWFDATIIKGYFLADNMEEVFRRFEKWLNDDYSRFMVNRVPLNLEWMEDYNNPPVGFGTVGQK